MVKNNPVNVCDFDEMVNNFYLTINLVYVKLELKCSYYEQWAKKGVRRKLIRQK